MSRPSTVSRVAVNAAAVLVATAGAVLLAIVCGFLVPLRFAGFPIPVCLLLAVGGAVAIVRFARYSTGSLAAIVPPTVAWFATTMVLASRGPGGDLVVLGDWIGLALLLLGSLAFAGSAYAEIVRRPRPSASGHIDDAEVVTPPVPRGTM